MSKTALIDYWTLEWYLEVVDSRFSVVSRDLARIGELVVDCPLTSDFRGAGRVLHVLSLDTFGAQGLN